jgi:RNA polymerase subunit RPABC4/transcription elongation factor Spt4
MIMQFIASMDGDQKTGFRRFRETKASIPVGIVMALAVSSLLVALEFVDGIGCIVVAVFAYIMLRVFRVRDLQYLLLTALLMLIIFAVVIFYTFELKAGVTFLDVLISTMISLILPFLLLSMLTWWMRKNLERTRAKLEKEGRLYPQGYGRCKKCGSLVLPGEVICRKCGEYIDVPEELRVKKVNYFECSECGREVPKDAGVCPYCGEAFEDDDAELP